MLSFQRQQVQKHNGNLPACRGKRTGSFYFCFGKSKFLSVQAFPAAVGKAFVFAIALVEVN
jgi:hypothetical protein